MESPVDGVFQLSAVADRIVHEQFTCDTRDHEDHTFCGIMFDVRCECSLPLEYLEITSLSVRGDLGPLTVWHTPNTHRDKHQIRDAWTRVYEAQHPPSRQKMVELRLPVPLRLRPGEACGLYIHSAAPGDDAIVYDNQRGRHVASTDRCLQLLPGMAHLSNRPFGDHGLWGSPWRRNREFVGRIAYGVRWQMWSPNAHPRFPAGFQRAVEAMLMASRRPESIVYLLHDYIVHFIMNQCEWWEWPLVVRPAAPAASRRCDLGVAGAVRSAGSASSGWPPAPPALLALPPPPPPRMHLDPEPPPAPRLDRPSRKRPRITLLPADAAGSCASRVAEASHSSDASEAASSSAAAGLGETFTTGQGAAAADAREAGTIVNGAADPSGAAASRHSTGAYAAADEIRTGLGGGFCERDIGTEERRRSRLAEEEALTRARKEARRRCEGCRRFACICCV